MERKEKKSGRGKNERWIGYTKFEFIFESKLKLNSILNKFLFRKKKREREKDEKMKIQIKLDSFLWRNFFFKKKKKKKEKEEDEKRKFQTKLDSFLWRNFYFEKKKKRMGDKKMKNGSVISNSNSHYRILF